MEPIRGRQQCLHRAAQKFSYWPLIQVKGSPSSRPVGRRQGWSNRAHVSGSGSVISPRVVDPGLLENGGPLPQGTVGARSKASPCRSECRASASTSQAAVQSRHLSRHPAQSPVSHGKTIFSSARPRGELYRCFCGGIHRGAPGPQQRKITRSRHFPTMER